MGAIYNRVPRDFARRLLQLTKSEITATESYEDAKGRGWSRTGGWGYSEVAAPLEFASGEYARSERFAW